MYGLTPEQKKKLEIAGKRDIQRFFEFRSREERIAPIVLSRTI